MAPILANTYRVLADDGRAVTLEDIQHDIKRLFQSNFTNFAAGKK